MSDNPTRTSKSESGAWQRPRFWSDPFVCPNVADLIAHYASDTRNLVESLRDQLQSLQGMTHRVCWQGPAWCWTFTFMHEAIPEDCAAQFAYLIPHPDGLRGVIPINEIILSEIALDERPDYIRNTIKAAPHPHEWWWPEWVVQTAEHVDWLASLATAKHTAIVQTS